MRMLFASFLFLILAVSVRGQCTPIPATGCPGQTAPFCGTPPQIGTQFIWRCPPTCFGTNIVQFVIIGTVLATPTNITPPLACVGPSCGLGCNPIFTAQAPGNTLAIPNNPALVGQMFCIQCACVNTAVPCLSLSVASKVTIV